MQLDLRTRVRTSLTPVYHSLRELPGRGSAYVAAESRRTGRSKAALLADSALSTVRHGATLNEYCCYRFGDAPRERRDEYLTARSYQRYFALVNDPDDNHLFEDKIEFHRRFAEFIGRPWMCSEDLGSGSDVEKEIVEGRWAVAKPRMGRNGREVTLLDLSRWDLPQLRAELVRRDLELIEGYITQHPGMSHLSPSGVNTVRVITHRHDDGVDVLGVLVRVTNGGHVDNVRGGGMAAMVDLNTGRVVGVACETGPGGREFERHPRTGARFDGHPIPMWTRVLELADAAAQVVPGVRSVGWDVAITPDGPVLVEGNHRWNRELWQVPARRGFRSVVQRYAPV